MQNFNGDDLLDTFNNLNVDLRNLNPHVIKGWFDTDCKKTRDLLNWLCVSLSGDNYVPLLEQAEYDKIEVQLDSQKCLEQLVELNPSYLSILDDKGNLDDLLLIQDEIDLLEDENKQLDKLIKMYENSDSNISLTLTLKTQREIESKVECKQSQENCQILCKDLDEFNKKLQNTLVKYDPDSHLVSFIDINDCHENFEKLSSFVSVLMDFNQTYIENSDEVFSSELETCRKRILHSHQIYLANRVESEKLKAVLEFLNTSNIHENMFGWSPLNTNPTLAVQNLYRKKMCDQLDDIAASFADQHLKQTRKHYIEQEYEKLRRRHRNISNILEIVTKYLSYYAVMNCLQFEEKKHVECIYNFFQKMISYINDDLFKCRSRTQQMKTIIEEYESYETKPIHEKSKFVSLIGKMLSVEDYSLKSVSNAICKFKTELNYLESQMYPDFKKEKETVRKLNENIKILQDFLISGPTNRVVLIPLDLQKIWSEFQEHLKKENASITQAVQVPQNMKKSMTKAQNYTRQLWIHFLANPSKLDSVLKQAEEDFNKRTQQYF